LVLDKYNKRASLFFLLLSDSLFRPLLNRVGRVGDEEDEGRPPRTNERRMFPFKWETNWIGERDDGKPMATLFRMAE
jgi:hypothetical protein